MKPLTLCLLLTAISCGAARVETFTLDLERPQQPFALSITEDTDATVTATLKASGSEFDPTGWTCILWYGTTGGGVTITNSAASYGSATWTIPSSSVPTNGRYAVQVFGVITNCIEEWGRGALTVRLNPAHDTLPIDWQTNSAWYGLISSTSNALAGALQNESQERNATNALFAAWLGSLFSSTSNWSTAFSWGDWHSAVAQKLDSSATNGWETGSHAAFLTDEADLAALRAYHYGSPDIIESPTNWFQFDGTNTIAGINTASVTNWNIVIPWSIGGVTISTIGQNAFCPNGIALEIESLILPRTVTNIQSDAFKHCENLRSVSMNNVRSIGDGAFGGCISLNSASLHAATSIGTYAFAACSNLTSVYFSADAPYGHETVYHSIPFNQVTNFVTSPTATGWGETFGGMPVVRQPLHADQIYVGTNRVALLSDIPPGGTNFVALADKELHADSYTNLIWRSVFSNGWHWLVAYTNTP